MDLYSSNGRGKRDTVAQMFPNERTSGKKSSSDAVLTKVSKPKGDVHSDTKAATEHEVAKPKVVEVVKERIKIVEVPVDDDPFNVRESGPKLDPNLKTCDLKYKYKGELQINFIIRLLGMFSNSIKPALFHIIIML